MIRYHPLCFYLNSGRLGMVYSCQCCYLFSGFAVNMVGSCCGASSWPYLTHPKITPLAAPPYIKALLTVYTPTRTLRSSSHHLFYCLSISHRSIPSQIKSLFPIDYCLNVTVLLCPIVIFITSHPHYHCIHILISYIFIFVLISLPSHHIIIIACFHCCFKLVGDLMEKID